MAFLKGSRVTGLSPKPLDVKGFTQSASEDLGDRLYSEHEVLLADAYKIVGDVTISDNLILTKLSDDGNAITVTGDASTTRTISGSGSLEGSTFAQTPNASMTGMTGVVGSAVTGGAGLSGMTSLGTVNIGTLGSGVTGGSGLNTLPNTSNISTWTITAFTASATTYITGWSGTTVSLTEASIPTVSGTVFTFPTTGFWEITMAHSFYIASSTAVNIENITIAVQLSTDGGSSWTTMGGAFGNFYSPANDWFREQPNFLKVIDVQNVSTYRVRFESYVYGSTGLYQAQGGGSNGETMFRKLGET